MTRTYQQLCPIARTLDLVGDRWTLIVLRDLFLGDRRFKELREHSPTIPTRILSARLKSLEAHGFLERVIYSQHPLRAEYRLTEVGRSLEPILTAIYTWGMEHGMRPKERADVRRRLEERAATRKPVARIPKR